MTYIIITYDSTIHRLPALAQADPLCSFGDFVAVSEVVDLATAQLLKIEVSDGIVAGGKGRRPCVTTAPHHPAGRASWGSGRSCAPRSAAHALRKPAVAPAARLGPPHSRGVPAQN